MQRWIAWTVTALALMLTVDAGMKAALADGDRREKDSVGKEWLLKEWSEREGRPYQKLLKEREEWYRKKWGENWYGPKSTCRILSPGSWKWEVVFTVPPDLAKKISSGNKPTHANIKTQWGARFWGMCFVWGPGGGDVTDIYALADDAIIHYDPVSRRIDVIGNPDEPGVRDGVNGRARLSPGDRVTLDPVTGRLYFIQGKSWRYVEKLLPFACSATGKVYHLPAVLAWNVLYLKVKSPAGGILKPYIGMGEASRPLFAVRTNPSLKTLALPGPYLVGRRPLLTPDGTKAYFAENKGADTDTLFNVTSLFDLETGKNLGRLKLGGAIPKNFSSGSDGPGSHGGTCVGSEGSIFNAQHGGCCGPCGGSPGRMMSIDPATGKVVTLYDSMPPDGSWEKDYRRGWTSRDVREPIDGPADALSLRFTSTLWQTQCPRTGAVYNGGWDHSGIRRYHDGFVTSFVDAEQEHNWPPRPGWKIDSHFYHGNSNPVIAPNGDLYISDGNSKVPRVLRFYRTDWPKQQPVNGYAEKFLPREQMEKLMVEYAGKYVANFDANSKIVESR